ncbi:MAG: D-2-hydroxyacid dehydrogenase [Spirochaetaceae bacterium]|jgi:phosphoglycerate dehydrogenase-like enzyme|nr:D-2-hydroxyacid dehydrogenase [Spirochaetaceae bacterium]
MRTIEILFLTSPQFCPDETEITLLKDRYPQVSLTVVEARSYTMEQLAKAEIVVGMPRRRDLKEAKNLRWFQTPSSGVTPYVDTSLYVHKDIILTNAKGTYGRQIADHVLGMIIAFNHNLLTYYDQMKEKLWLSHWPTKDLWDSTLLIIGYGDIGSNLAMRAKAHAMRVIVVKRTPMEVPSHVDAIYTSDSLDEVLPQADYVAVCAAATPDTENLLDRKRLLLMKQGSILINVARGSLVDEIALAELLETGHIAAAGLDVTREEPLEEESPLWTLPNVLITPHASGFSLNDPHYVFSLFLENLGHYLGDGEMKNLVDFSRKY